jgi:hypothetical protein
MTQVGLWKGGTEATVVGLGGTVEVLEELGLGVVVVLLVVVWGVTLVVDWACDADFEVLVEKGMLELVDVLDDTAVDAAAVSDVDVVLERVLELDEEELGVAIGVVEEGCTADGELDVLAEVVELGPSSGSEVGSPEQPPLVHC